MAVAALKHKPARRTFYATMHVTGEEQMGSKPTAPRRLASLLVSDGGHRSLIGECIHAEIVSIDH